MEGKLIKKGEELFELFTQGFLKGSTNHELIDSLNAEEGNVRYKLSLSNCQVIERGYDLDELADENTSDCDASGCYPEDYFKQGFQKALELMGDKKFTEEDVREAVEISRKGSMQQQHNGWGMPTHSMFVLNNLSPDDIIQSLQQNEWDVVIEMEKYGFCEGCRRSGMWHCAHADSCGSSVELERPKLDENGCLILKRKK